MRDLGTYERGLLTNEPSQKPHWNLPEKRLLYLFGAGEVGSDVGWETLSRQQKEFQSKKMEVHAAMVDRIDQEIGKVLNLLKDRNAFSNTVVFFLSDNGASAEQIVRGDGHNRLSPAGSKDTYYSLGPGWSTASNTPFRRYKYWVHEGGVATPLIVHWPDGVRARGEIRDFLGHTIDLAPTIVELAGGNFRRWMLDRNAPAPPGISLIRSFNDPEQSGHQFLYFDHEGNRALRTQDWKIVSSHIGNSDGVWELFNMQVDRSEVNDFSQRRPMLTHDLIDRWTTLERTYRADSQIGR